MAEGDSHSEVHMRHKETTESNGDDMHAKGQSYQGEIIKEKIRVEVEDTSTVPLLLPQYFANGQRNSEECPDGQELHNSVNSSVNSSDDDVDSKLHKFKRRPKQLCINRRTRLFKITTCTYRYRHQKIRQHYITDIKQSTDIEGETGVILNDELCSVNEVKLQGKKQKNIIKIFKKIKPDISGLINLKLELRRWKDHNTGPVQSTIIRVRLNLELKPDEGDKRSSVKTRCQKNEFEETLPTGNVINITFGCDRKACFKVLATEASYLLASDAGNISVGILNEGDSANTRISTFNVRPFQGYDDSLMPDERWVFGVIIHCDVDGHTKYMTSCFGDKSNGLAFKCLSDIDDELKNSPDERFFLMHEFGNKTVLESMLYRGQCVHYDATSDTLNMQSLNIPNTDMTNADFLVELFRLDGPRHFSRQLTRIQEAK